MKLFSHGRLFFFLLQKMKAKPLSQFKLARMQARGGQEDCATGAYAASATVPVLATPAAHAPAPAPHRSAVAASGGGSPQRRDGGVGAAGLAGRGEETVEQKVERYQKFVDETLRVKLAQALDQREEVVKEIEAYEKLHARRFPPRCTLCVPALALGKALAASCPPVPSACVAGAV
jgi:hypothetical protein